VKTSRRIYQCMLTYTLNEIIKTVEIALLLSVGVMLTRSFIVTPLLIVLLLFTNDFVTMSIATGTVSYSLQPDRWHIRWLVLISLLLGSLILLFSFGTFLAAAIALAPVADTGVHHLGFYRSGQCLSRPRTPAFLEVEAWEVAGYKFSCRYCSGEHSCFPWHSDECHRTTIIVRYADRLRLLSRSCGFYKSLLVKESSAGIMREISFWNG